MNSTIKNEELEQWCKANLPDTFFRDSSDKIKEYAQVSEWAASMTHHYKQNAINDFLQADEADAFIVAFALSDKNNITIVTQEISQPNRMNRIEIPETCEFFDIKYINTIELFRALGETFLKAKNKKTTPTTVPNNTTMGVITFL